MKYVKKTTILGAVTQNRQCTPLNIYNLFTVARARQRAEAEAQNKIPPSVSNGNCTWSTIAEVKNATYKCESGALQPSPRCSPENPTPGNGSHGGSCSGRKEMNEYAPGGSKPPCAGGTEGVCVQKGKDEARWSTNYQPSDWKMDPPAPGNFPKTVYLSYSYRWVANSLMKKGSGPCPSPPGPGSWFLVEGLKVGEFKTEIWRRCEDRMRTFDCCCSCPPDQVKVPQVVPGLAPCYSYNNASQAQLESLLKAATAALVVGACAAAVVFAAKYTALFLAGLAANPVTAGCAIRMIPLIVPCIVQEDEGDSL